MNADRVQGVVARLLAEADDAAASGDPATAESLALDALAIDPGNARAERLREAIAASRPLGGLGDRRQLTAVFCDLVGSTDLAEHFDPEVIHDMTLAYQEVCAESIARFGGTVHQFQGDGVVAFFCFPRSHDDDPLRAVLASLEIAERMRVIGRSTQRRWGVELQCRIGIHTGLVSVQDGFGIGRKDRRAVWGSTPNLAARLQSVAAPGTVVMSADTAELVGYRVTATSLGEHSLKGISRPVEVFRVDAARAASGLDLPSEQLTPLVGRSAEISVLESHWQAAVGRRTDRVPLVVTGAPGVGKTRLLRVLRERVGIDGGVDLRVTCEDRAAPSLTPVRQALTRLLGVRPDDRAATALEAMRTRFGEDASLVTALARALELPGGTTDGDALGPTARREATLTALLDAVEHLATDPVLVLVEDGHWADPTTVEWVVRLSERHVPGVAVVISSRPADLSRWGSSEVLAVEPLGPEDIRELIRSAAGDEVPVDVLDTASARSDGIPLFAEQLARTISRPGSEAGTTIPGTLKDLLQAQLDAAGGAKAYAQVAASLGRDFDAVVLFRVAQRLAEAAGETAPGEDAVTEALTRLAELDLVVPVSAGARHLRFRHALVRDAAYDSQLLTERASRHLAIAEELAGGSSDDSASIAFHYDCGGDADRAIDWYLRAAVGARDRGEFAEARTRLDRALELLDVVPPGRRSAHELRVRTELGITASGISGWAAPEVVDEFSRCVELCRSVDESGTGADLVRALSGLWSYWISEGDFDRCAVVSRQLVAQLDRSGVGGRVATVQSIRGSEAFWTGRLVEARTALLQAAELYDDERFRSTEWGLVHDLLVAVQSLLGPLLVITGDEAAGIATLDAGVARAAALEGPTGPFSEAYVRAYRAWVGRMRGDVDAARSEADRVVDIGMRRGFAEWVLVGAMHQAAAHHTAGDHERACEELERTVRDFRSLGGGTGSTLFLVDLADAQREAGRHGEASSTLDEALRLAVSGGHGIHLAETHRSRAELLATSHGPDDPAVAADLDAALDVAQRQSAILWGARAARLTRRLRPTHRTEDVDDWLERAARSYGSDSPLLRPPADVVAR